MAICCYQTVKDALAQSDKVIIITDRSCGWHFFQGKVIVYDFASLFDNEYNKRVSFHGLGFFWDYYKYRRYCHHLNKVVKTIVNEEDFIFYMPSMAKDVTVTFVYNKYCRGYYYVDEGTLAYRNQELLSQMIPTNFTNSIRKLLKIEDHYHYEILPSFKGTVSITKEAFKWNKNNTRIVNPIKECVLELKTNMPSFDDVIVTSYFSEDINIINKGIDYTIKFILNSNPDSRIGIKFHPFAITNNNKKTSMVMQCIRNKYNERISIIPNEVSIEAMSLVYHPRLFTLFALSSIILYGLLLKSSDGYLVYNEEDNVSIKQVDSVEEYFKLIGVAHNKGKK